MVRLIVKLAIAALIANAAYRLGTAYLSFYRFKDAVTEVVMHGKGKSDDELKDRVVELAMKYDLPLSDERVAIRREDQHTYVDGTYTQPVDLLPGYRYPWSFTLSVDAYMIQPVKIGDLAAPQ